MQDILWHFMECVARLVLTTSNTCVSLFALTLCVESISFGECYRNSQAL